MIEYFYFLKSDNKLKKKQSSSMGCCNDRQMRASNAGQKGDKKSKVPQQSPNGMEQHFKSQPNKEQIGQEVNDQVKSEHKIPQTGFVHKRNSRESELLDQILSSYHQCKYFYEEHDIDEAHFWSQQFTKKFNQYKKLDGASQVVLQSKNAYFKLIEQVNQEYTDVITISEEIDKGGWVEKSNKKGVKISTRREGSTVGTLVQAELDQPFQILISILIEMDLYKHFMPFMKVSRQQKIVARNCRIGYTENHIPLLSVREAFFQGIGYNRLDHNKTLFLCTRSLHNRPDLQQKLGYKCRVNEKFIQLEYKYFILIYKPICRGKGNITLAMNVDTKMDFIPIWLQDKISQDFGNQFYTSILKQTKGFQGSIWQKNVNANPQLFNFFKGAIDTYLIQMENPQLKVKKKEEIALKNRSKTQSAQDQPKPKTYELKQQSSNEDNFFTRSLSIFKSKPQ